MNFKKTLFNHTLFLGLATAFLFVGCSKDEEVAEFNKPALYWYQQMADSITRGNLDKADSYFISLKSEHMRSPLMPTSLMMLAHAHMNKEEYLLA
ncbi:MAG: outer membrane protein assembly factor BamD, partial [Bacteroidota bacterium]